MTSQNKKATQNGVAFPNLNLKNYENCFFKTCISFDTRPLNQLNTSPTQNHLHPPPNALYSITTAFSLPNSVLTTLSCAFSAFSLAVRTSK